MPDFIAVDGESFTSQTDHLYVLLASSTGDHQFDSAGLSTARCLEFLLSHRPKATLVAFGWNYDVNMILRDLDTPSLILLWKTGEITWKGYTIQWIPGKVFSVKSHRRRVKVYDVFGFFQSSFVKALEAWGFGPQESIEAMKSQRSTFDPAMKQQVIEYCLQECYQLADLCHQLSKALESVSLDVKSWIGAGAIASTLLQRQGIENHHALDSTYPPELYSVIRSSYYGGRVELFQQGTFPVLYDYDISSAYPSEIVKLPSLKDATWSHSTRFKPNEPFAIWHCRWKISEAEPVMPFPYRHQGQIYYPREGEGWYHASEVRAALALVDGIQILEGWVLHPASDDSPFDFVPHLYNERKRLKQQGHAGEKVLKLGLNSLYGKLAQGVGFQGQSPKFQSFLWAGMITAGTRARVLALANMDKVGLAMVATDGVFFTNPIDVDVSKNELGALELTILDNVFIAQPGIYEASSNGKTYGKSRGFFTKEIDFPNLRAGYESSGSCFIGHVTSTRFNGLGHMMVTGHRDTWRTWTTSQRKLSLYPSRKFITPGQPLQPIVRHHPPSRVADTMSEPYVTKRPLGEMSEEELAKYINFIQGNEQPLRD